MFTVVNISASTKPFYFTLQLAVVPLVNTLLPAQMAPLSMTTPVPVRQDTLGLTAIQSLVCNMT